MFGRPESLTYPWNQAFVKLCRFYSGIFCIALDTSIYDDTVSGAGGGDSNREEKIPVTVTGFSTPSMSSVWICFTNCQCPATLKESSASQSLWRNRDRYYENILTEQLRTTCSLKPSYSTQLQKNLQVLSPECASLTTLSPSTRKVGLQNRMELSLKETRIKNDRLGRSQEWKQVDRETSWQMPSSRIMNAFIHAYDKKTDFKTHQGIFITTEDKGREGYWSYGTQRIV